MKQSFNLSLYTVYGLDNFLYAIILKCYEFSERISDIPEQIRAHLGIGIACPIIGDLKYNFSRREAGKGIPPRLSDSALQDLNITGNLICLSGLKHM